MDKIVFTYQHTCKKGQSAYILATAAFQSVVKKKNGRLYIPFLGSGYYYWEENIPAAHSWGKRQYQDDYNIVEYQDAKIPGNQLLDFMNRRDISYYNKLVDIYKTKRPDSDKWLPGQWIEFFKRLGATEKGKFPFKYFRAEENFPTAEENQSIKVKTLLNYKGYYLFLNPHLILCATEKNDLNCLAKNIIY